MRLADFIMLSIFGAVMIIGTNGIITDLNSQYGASMNITEMDSVMNSTAIENASTEFQTDIRTAQNSTNFFGTIYAGAGAAGSLIGLTMTAVDELFGLAGAILGGIFGLDSSIGSLITGAMVTLVALLIISTAARWELTR